MASFGTAPLRAPFVDARRGEIFGALYDADLALVAEEVVMPFPNWHKQLPAGAELLTPAPELYPAAATHTPRALAAAIGRLAATRLVDPVQLDANYVRRSDAELKWVDR